jgi:YggT family protein
MGGGVLTDALTFLIRTLFELYIVAVALRFLLQWVRADFYNPLSQFLVKVTNPPLRPLRRIIPGYGGMDLASLVLMIVLKAVEIALLGLVVAGRIPAPLGLFVISLAEILKLLIYIFMFAIFIQVVLSWVNPGAYNAATVLIYRLTEPLLAPARRLIPPMGGLDFSPLVVLILLQLTLIVLIRPLTQLGYSLAGFLIR